MLLCGLERTICSAANRAGFLVPLDTRMFARAGRNEVGGLFHYDQADDSRDVIGATTISIELGKIELKSGQDCERQEQAGAK